LSSRKQIIDIEFIFIRGRSFQDEASGCWLWQSELNSAGYGRISQGNNHTVAKAKVPYGMDLDYLCRTPRCCNPDHLEPVTRSENIRRGARWNADLIKQKPETQVGRDYSGWLEANIKATGARLKTHCANGHPLSSNVERTASGRYRSCPICGCEKTARYRERLKHG